MLDGSINIKCQWCGVYSTIDEANELTYSKCINREMKRAYTDLHKKKAFLRDTQAYYVCPNCGRWFKGSQWVIESDDPEISKLGGEPIISLNNK